jgi:hypothetical protein
MKYLLSLFVGLLISAQCLAQVVTAKGMGSVSYSWMLSAEDKEKALQQAKISAVERYFAENGEAESENFDAIRPAVEASLDKFILTTTVLNEETVSANKKYNVTVRVELNVAKLRNAVRGSSGVAKAAPGSKSQLVYVFIGREVSSSRSYDDRVVKRREVGVEDSYSSSREVSGKESESVRGGSVGTSGKRTATASASAQRSVKLETGGSTTRRADDVAYRLLPLNNVKTSITSVFSQGGFQVADPEFVLDDAIMKSVNADFSTGNDLAPSTIRAVVGGLKKAQVPLLVLATLDVGAPMEDEATGMRRVAVTVTGRVLDITGNLPREVASVPAVEYAAVGADNASASGKALKDASLAAAREVVSRLNAAGVQ